MFSLAQTSNYIHPFFCLQDVPIGPVVDAGESDLGSVEVEEELAVCVGQPIHEVKPGLFFRKLTLLFLSIQEDITDVHDEVTVDIGSQVNEGTNAFQQHFQDLRSFTIFVQIPFN